MDLSIIIATRNNAKSLSKSLHYISKLEIDFECIEIFVADNGSTDSTKIVCDIYRKLFPNFIHIFDPRPGQIVGWHSALLESNSGILAFIDDDVLPTPGWAAAVIECFEDPEIGIATGRILPEFEERPPNWQNNMILKNKFGSWSALWGMLDFGSEIKIIPADFVWGSNFLVRRKLLIDAGGFHPGGMPEDLFHFTGDGDVSVGRAISDIGFKALYHPKAAVTHFLPKARNSNPEEIRRWIFGEGLVTSYILMRQLAKKHPNYSPDDLINHVSDVIKPMEIANIGKLYLTDKANLPDEIQYLFNTSGKVGFLHHQNYFISDSLFRDWVLQPNYLDINACYKHPDLLKDIEGKF